MQLDAHRRRRRSCACRRSRPERESGGADRAALARPRRATRTCASRSCSPPACAGSSAATSCRPRTTATPRDAPRLPRGPARGDRRCSRRSELARETLGDRLVDCVVAQQARASGTSTSRTVTEFERAALPAAALSDGRRLDLRPTTPSGAGELDARCSPSSASRRAGWRRTGRCGPSATAARAPPALAVVARARRSASRPASCARACAADEDLGDVPLRRRGRRRRSSTAATASREGHELIVAAVLRATSCGARIARARRRVNGVERRRRRARRLARAQPRDLPGRDRRASPSTSPTWSTSC